MSWALRQQSCAERSSTTASRAPPVRWPATASSRRAWSLHSMTAILVVESDNENDFQYASRVLRLALLLALSLPLAACGSDRAASGSGAGSFHIVATTRQVADFARNVAGGRAGVTQILAPNTDPHEYEVRPGDVKALAEGDLVLRSGGDVDEWLDDARSAAGVNASDVVNVGEAAGLEGDDPHWWQDPARVEKGVIAIRDALVRA